MTDDSATTTRAATPTALKKALEPYPIKADALQPGYTTYYETPHGWKVDERIKQQVPSNACHGIHFLCGSKSERGMVKCWNRNSVVYVRPTSG